MAYAHQCRGRVVGGPSCGSGRRSAHSSLLINKRRQSGLAPVTASSSSSSDDVTRLYRVPNGIYIRNDSKSEMLNYSRMLSLLELSGIQRMTAINLIEGVEVRVDAAQKKATVTYLTVVPFYNVVETYSLDGGKRTRNKRRDLKGGDMICSAALKNDAPIDSGETNMVLRLDMYWEEPNAGRLLEEMHVARGKEQELVVRSTVKVKGGTETARIVYSKVEKFEPKYQWNPLQALRLMDTQK